MLWQPAGLGLAGVVAVHGRHSTVCLVYVSATVLSSEAALDTTCSLFRAFSSPVANAAGRPHIRNAILSSLYELYFLKYEQIWT